MNLNSKQVATSLGWLLVAFIRRALKAVGYAFTGLIALIAALITVALAIDGAKNLAPDTFCSSQVNTKAEAITHAVKFLENYPYSREKFPDVYYTNPASRRIVCSGALHSRFIFGPSYWDLDCVAPDGYLHVVVVGVCNGGASWVAGLPATER